MMIEIQRVDSKLKTLDHSDNTNTFIPPESLKFLGTRVGLVPLFIVNVCWLFVSFPQKRNGIVFSSGVNYLHSD